MTRATRLSDVLVLLGAAALGVLAATVACSSSSSSSPKRPPSGAVTGQVDRMGRPAIATLIVAKERKDEFNKNPPALDVALFRTDAVIGIGSAPVSNAANAEAIVDRLFPDILTIDTSLPTSYAQNLNGRALQDDVIDVTLDLLTSGRITTDNVGPRTFLTTFPYMNAPIQPE